MPRYKITIEYDGSEFCGWQIQKTEPSVQEALNKAAEAFLQEEIMVTGAGRTDAGVHAFAQVAHFDSKKTLCPYRMCQAFNAYLRPQKISVIKAEIVEDTFHARFSAKERFYVYKILNRRSRPALDDNRVWWVGAPLELEPMQRASKCLMGEHDFTTFRATACQAKSPIRTLNDLRIEQVEDLFLFHLSAPSFLHHQVRNIVGTLKLVGEGKWEEPRVKEALEAKARKAGGPTAPPEGLYFKKIMY